MYELQTDQGRQAADVSLHHLQPRSTLHAGTSRPPLRGSIEDLVRLVGILTLAVTLTGIYAHTARAVPPQAGDVFITNHVMNGSGHVMGLDPKTSQTWMVASGGFLFNPVGIAVEADGHLVVTDMWDGKTGGAVIRIEPDSGKQTVLSKGGYLIAPYGIAVGSGGAIYVAETTQGGSVIRIDPQTGQQHALFKGDLLRSPHDIEVDPHGDVFVVDSPTTDSGIGGRVVALRTDGSQELLTHGGFLQMPRGLALDSTGRLMVVESIALTGALVDVDQINQTQTVLSNNGLLDRGWFAAADRNGHVVVANPLLPLAHGGSVIRVNPQTGIQTVLTVGGRLRFPLGVAIMPCTDAGCERAEVPDEHPKPRFIPHCDPLQYLQVDCQLDPGSEQAELDGEEHHALQADDQEDQASSETDSPSSSPGRSF